MQRFGLHVEGFTFEGLWWKVPKYLDKYGASVLCPQCNQKFVSSPKNTALKSQNKVKSMVQKHINKKHKGQNAK